MPIVPLKPGVKPDPEATSVVRETAGGGTSFESWTDINDDPLPYKDWKNKGARGMRTEYNADGKLVRSSHLGPTPKDNGFAPEE